MVDKITFAGTSHKSGAKAARALSKLASLKISAVEVMRITQQIGTELLQSREHQAALHQRRELPSTSAAPVEIACVEVDGGRMRTRAPETGRGVHDQKWKETKVAALWKMEGKTFDNDPHPEPPRCFLDPVHVPKLVREIKRQRAEQHARDDEDPVKTGSEPTLDDLSNQQTPEREWPPKRVFRTCVATFKDVYGFGPLVAAEAQRRGFYDASRQVFLGDGDHKNWTVHKLHFPDFTAITDFVHPVTYIYEAAAIVTNSAAAHWEQYVDWMRACWQGQVDRVLGELRTWQTRLGSAEQGLPDNDPRIVLASILTYLGNNQSRMNYPDYRTRGLPITSCLVESLIKEINHRVKGTEKFWNRLDATQGEAILQTTASQLSDGEPLTKFILSRPGSLYYRRTTPDDADHPNKPG
jgi:hypothetical protein